MRTVGGWIKTLSYEILYELSHACELRVEILKINISFGGFVERQKRVSIATESLFIASFSYEFACETI